MFVLLGIELFGLFTSKLIPSQLKSFLCHFRAYVTFFLLGIGRHLHGLIAGMVSSEIANP